MATDPVCGMTVDEKSAAGRAEYRGENYSFCSETCLHKFQAAPQDYAHPPTLTAVPGAVYICPMHPDVRQDAPGSCPKCGMVLEPLLPPPTATAPTEYVCPMHPEVVRSEPGNVGFYNGPDNHLMFLYPRGSFASLPSPQGGTSQARSSPTIAVVMNRRRPSPGPRHGRVVIVFFASKKFLLGLKCFLNHAGNGYQSRSVCYSVFYFIFASEQKIIAGLPLKQPR